MALEKNLDDVTVDLFQGIYPSRRKPRNSIINLRKLPQYRKRIAKIAIVIKNFIELIVIVLSLADQPAKIHENSDHSMVASAG